MTLRTWTFAISFIQSSAPVARALICPDARYIAVRWQDGRLDRRELSSTLWPGLEEELTRDLASGPVSQSSLISTVLVGSMGALMRVSFVEIRPVNVGRTHDATNVLDAAMHFGQRLADHGGVDSTSERDDSPPTRRRDSVPPARRH